MHTLIAKAHLISSHESASMPRSPHLSSGKDHASRNPLAACKTSASFAKDQWREHHRLDTGRWVLLVDCSDNPFVNAIVISISGKRRIRDETPNSRKHFESVSIM